MLHIAYRRVFYIEIFQSKVRCTIIFSKVENQDDRDFLEAVYLKYVKMLYYMVSNYIFEKALIEDVIHDTFLKLIPQVSKLQAFDDNRLRAYIMAATRNTAYTKSAKLKKVRQHFVDDDPTPLLADITDKSLSLDEVLIRQEETQKLQALIQALEPNDRFLLEAKYIEQLSDDEIAAVLHVKASSIRMMLTRVRRKLLNQLMNEENANG